MTTSTSSNHPMISFSKVNKWYGEYHALNDVTAEVAKGEVLVVCGPSGSGKSTLIRTVNRLEEIQQGRIEFDAQDVHSPALDLNKFRSHVGFVFQSFNLFPHLSVAQNIMLAPVNVLKKRRADARAHAVALLERVGLAAKADAFPGQLSGGQQQRVAIARALAPSPKLLIADEPTGNLDAETGRQIADLLFAEQRDRGMTLVLVTHDAALAARCSRQVRVRSGEIISGGALESVVEAQRQEAASA